MRLWERVNRWIADYRQAGLAMSGTQAGFASQTRREPELPKLSDAVLRGDENPPTNDPRYLTEPAAEARHKAYLISHSRERNWRPSAELDAVTNLSRDPERAELQRKINVGAASRLDQAPYSRAQRPKMRP